MADTNFGNITVSVRTADGALPVERAIVTVKDAGENILAVFFTDADGNTPRLRVPAPDIANSESPDAPGVPFFTYNIDTDKEGYVSVRNLNVPVYPGITSIQPVAMLPLAEGQREPYPNDAIRFNESIPPVL